MKRGIPSDTTTATNRPTALLVLAAGFRIPLAMMTTIIIVMICNLSLMTTFELYIDVYGLFHVLLTIKSRPEVPLDNPTVEGGSFLKHCSKLSRFDT